MVGITMHLRHSVIVGDSRFSAENHSTKSFEWCPIKRTSRATKQTRTSRSADSCCESCLPPTIGSGSGRLTPD